MFPLYTLHRVGRTGRAGNEGFAFTFITKEQVGKVRMNSPVLKIRFGPPNADFWSVWSSQKARKFRQIQPTTKVRILCFDCPLRIKINNSCLLKFFIQSTSASMFNQYTYFGLKYDTCG